MKDLQSDSNHRTVTDAEKQAWNDKYDKPLNGIPASDIASGVIPDVSQFITKSVDDLVNYYLKSETYTKAEVNELIAAINQFHYEVHASLQEITDPANNVLYLIGPTGSGSDKYEEYVYDPTKQDPWVKIGDTSIDLSGYVTTEALNTALAAYVTSTALTTALTDYYTKTETDTLLEDTPDFVEEGVSPEMVDEFQQLRTNLYQALTDAQQVTEDADDAADNANEKAVIAQDAATLANSKAGIANDAAVLANQKAAYADEQGDYAKQQGDYAKQQGDYIANLDLAEFVEDNSDNNPFDII